MNIKGIKPHWQALQEAFDAPWPGPTGDAVELGKGAVALTVYPQDGARIASLRAFGYELLRQWDPQRRAFQYGAFPMVPWVGRLGDGQLNVAGQTYALPANKPPHALHGMACYSDWRIVAQTPDTLTLEMALASPWPWTGRVVQHFCVQDDALALRLEIHTDAEAFPASAGWHPWFNKWLDAPQDPEAALQVSFNADWQEEPGSNELPTGNRIAPRPGPWDDCFGFDNDFAVRLEWPHKIALEMTSTAPALVVFDKQPDATCVNPLTQAPNAINTSPQWVRVDAPLIIETRWQFSHPA